MVTESPAGTAIVDGVKLIPSTEIVTAVVCPVGVTGVAVPDDPACSGLVEPRDEEGDDEEDAEEADAEACGAASEACALVVARSGRISRPRLLSTNAVHTTHVRTQDRCNAS